MTRNTFKLKLKSAKMVTPTVRHLEFVHTSEDTLQFTPGQFITFHFEMEGVELQRSYSIASIPTQTNSIEIAVSPFEGGPGTKLLFGIEPGDIVETSGPFGRLILRDEKPKRYVLIATGTGVTPYRAMLPELQKRIEQDNLHAVIYLGVQTPIDLLYGEDFIAFANQHSNLQFHVFYSRQMPENPHDFEHSGHVQTGFENLNLNPQEDIIYLCGNPNMIDDAFNRLRELGFETNQVRREKYISPKK